MAPEALSFRTSAAFCYHPRARGCGHFHAMPNIRQQEKRVRSAARQRLENLRYRSTIKTLHEAAGDGRRRRAKPRTSRASHRELVRMIDRAAARGAIHRNAAARKKSQAARLVAAGRRHGNRGTPAPHMPTPRSSGLPIRRGPLRTASRRQEGRRAGAGSTRTRPLRRDVWRRPGRAPLAELDQRALQLQVGGQSAVALERQIERGQPHCRVAQLLLREPLRLTRHLLGMEGMHAKLDRLPRAVARPPRRGA